MTARSVVAGRMAREISWATLGQALNAVAALVMLKVWAVYLSPAELGLMALVIATASVLAGVVVDPLVRAMLVRYATHAQHGQHEQFRAISRRTVATAVGACIAATIAVGVPLAALLRLHWSTPLLVAGLFAVDATRYFEQTLLAARRQQREVALIAVGDVCCRLAGVWLALAHVGASAQAAVTGNLLGASVALGVLLLALRRDAVRHVDVVVDDASRRRMRDELLRIAGPIVPSNILTNVSEVGSRYLIAAMLGLQQAGIFVAAYGLLRRPFGMLSDVGYTAMTPAYSEAVAKRDLVEAARLRRLWLAGITLVSLAGAVVFYAAREPIVATLLSKNYADAGTHFFGIAIAVTILNVNVAINGLLLIHGSSKAVLVGNTVAAVATTLLTIAFTPLLGLDGAIWGLGVGHAVQFAVLVSIARRLRTDLA